MNWNNLNNATFENDIVRLRRLRVSDREALKKIVFQPSTWTHFVAQINTIADLDTFIEQAIQDSLNGTRAVFVIIDKATGELVGSTAYGNISKNEAKLEIGWSWLCEEARGTGVNKAAKALLINHAFEALGCERVEFKTDILNTVAKAGLASIGAMEEGVLRSFNYMPGGRRRDVVYYSILRPEWLNTRALRD